MALVLDMLLIVASHGAVELVCVANVLQRLCRQIHDALVAQRLAMREQRPDQILPAKAIVAQTQLPTQILHKKRSQRADHLVVHLVRGAFRKEKEQGTEDFSLLLASKEIHRLTVSSTFSGKVNIKV